MKADPPPPMTDRLLERLERATADLDPPFAVVDLDALWQNAADMERRAAPKPIRLASKSMRCRALQERVLARPGFHGTLAFTLPEALWLARLGLRDILVAYPTTDREALRALARFSREHSDARGEHPGARVSVMVDSVAQLDLIEAAIDASAAAWPDREQRRSDSEPPRSDGHATPVRVCIDVDAGLWLFGGRVRIGVKRSPVHTPEQAAALTREIVARERFELVGIMAYEAQIAGVGDAPPGRRLRAVAIRALQARSARELAPRRAAAVAAVEEVLAPGAGRLGGLGPDTSRARAPANRPLEFVNGGGSGSLHLTAAEDVVTEVAAGSGLYGPTLFDAYRAFQPQPAMLFALPVVRRPSASVATVLGGGYLASGPGDTARLPSPFLPVGLRLDRQEGAGEVQTPLLGDAAKTLRVGDRVWLRHAKAGELCERFDRLHLIEGERVVEIAPTYRGEGRCFL
jgi:D-serine deaminase-like pyridoxal phosphate-dependent protein